MKINEFGLFLILTFATILLGVGFYLLKKRLEKRLTLSRPGESSSLNHEEELAELVAKTGYNTNSIYHLYGQIQHFYPKLASHGDFAPHPALGYHVQSGQNILLTDPLCPPEMTKEALLSFVKFSENRKQEALFFAVNSHTAIQAKELGFKILKIGQEPIFDLKTYSSENLPFKTRSAIKQVFKKGIVIEEFSIEELKSQRLIDSLNEVLDLWLLSRQSDGFKLLTEVNPMSASEGKKFFVASHGEVVEAFLACSPIYPRNGYFLHDLIRRPFALNGISEALIFSALESLIQDGYSMATLGISPLSGLEPENTPDDFPGIRKILHFVFKHFRTGYNFQALYNFKKKFMPTSEEPAYLAVPNKGFKLRYAWGFLKLFSDFNLVREFNHKLRQWHSGHNIPRPLAWAIDRQTVTHSPLVNLTLESIGLRFKFTLFMLFLNVFAFIYTADSLGKIEYTVLERYGFSYEHFADHRWFILFTSNFMHFNEIHLIGNMIALLIFTGALEILGGTSLAILVYCFGMEANIPNGALILPFLKTLAPTLFRDTYSFIDVGASLGVMSCFGALAYFLKKKIRYTMLAGSIIFFIFYSVRRNELIGIDHAVAVVIGYGISILYFRKRASQKAFETAQFKFFNVAAHKMKLNSLKTNLTGK